MVEPLISDLRERAPRRLAAAAGADICTACLVSLDYHGILLRSRCRIFCLRFKPLEAIENASLFDWFRKMILQHS